MRVDASNVEAFRAWDGPEGDFWAEHEARFDDAMVGYQRRFLTAAAITPTDRVLDIGCGNGQTTRDAARLATAGSALGVDLSGRMIGRARQRAAEQRLANAAFIQADAQVHRFDDAAFDVAISRTGAMFFGDPVAAFRNIARALRPGGRLALLTWQPLGDNEWVGELREALAAGRILPVPAPDAPGPFSLADPGRIRRILRDAGFGEPAIEGVREPMLFGRDATDAYAFVRRLGFAEAMLGGLDDAARDRALDALRRSIVAHERVDGVWYHSAAWLTTAQNTMAQDGTAQNTPPNETLRSDAS